MQLSGNATTMQRGDAVTRRSDQSVISRPAARYYRSAVRPYSRPVRAVAQAKPSAVGENTSKRKTLVEDMLKKVKAGAARLFDFDDVAPEQVTTLTPDDTTSCLQYLSWSLAVHELTTVKALEVLRKEESTKKVIPETLVNLTGSSQLSERLFFRHIKTDTQALVGLQDDGKGGVELVVSYRGSVTKADWLTDLLIDMDPVSRLVPSQTNPKMQLHAGFMESANDFLTDKTTLLYGPRDATEADRVAFQKLAKGEALTEDEKKLVAEMKSCKTLKELGDLMVAQSKKRLTKVVIVGHSLGGALATLTAYWCRKVGWPNLPVDYYSYGSPRVANKVFADEWNQTMITSQPNAKVFRVMYRHDLVPAIPRADLPIPMFSDSGFDRYIHVEGGVLLVQPGVEPMIGNQGTPKQWPQLKVDPATGWQAQLRRRPNNLENKEFEDHHIPHYRDALESARKNYTAKFGPLSG